MLIIDAYNVLHAVGVLPPRLAGMGVPALIRMLSMSRYARRRITLVCDGGAGGAASGVRIDGVYVLYSGSHAEADDVIETLIKKYHRGNPLDVVSSDRRLRKAARRVGAGSIRSEDFLWHLVRDESRPPRPSDNAMRRQVPLDAYSVAAWCREFGVPEPAGTTGPGALPSGADEDQPAARSSPARDRAGVTRPGATRRAPPPPTLGEPLRVTLPDAEGDPPPLDARSPAEPPEHPIDRPPTAPIPAARSAPPESTPGPPPAASIDPLVLRALEEWRGRLTLDDLDMRRWMPDATPMPPDDPPRVL